MPFRKKDQITASEYLPDLKAQLSFELFGDWTWWQQSFQIAMTFAPFCSFCGLGLGLVNVLIVIGNGLLESQLARFNAAGSAPSEANLAHLLVVLVVLLVCALIVGALGLWLSWIWLMRLTAFSHAWLAAGGCPDLKQFKRSIELLGSRKGFISLAWAVGSLYLIIPLSPIVAVLSMKVLAASKLMVGDIELFEMPEVFTSPLISNVLMVITAMLSVISMAYMLVLTAYSAVAQASPAKTANAALQACLRQPLYIITIAAFVLLGNVMVSAPQSILFFTDIPNLVCRNPWLASIAQIWFGISSILLWPLSMAPICHSIAAETQGGDSSHD